MAHPHRYVTLVRAVLRLPLVVALALLGGFATSSHVGAAHASDIGLVAAYSFDAGSGTTLEDSSGNLNTGTISGAAWTGDGRFGGALAFDGVDDLVTVLDAPALALTSGMTLEAWVEPSRLGSWKAVLMKEQLGSLAYGLFADSDTGVPTGEIFVGGVKSVGGSGQVPVDEWTHLATTYDGVTQRLYVDGVEVASRAVLGTIAVSAGALLIGGNAFDPTQSFNGVIDEVRIYNRALSQSEVQSDMSTPITPQPTSSTPVAAYGFGAGAGTTAADDSGNGNTGTISGAAWTSAGRYGSALAFDGVDDWVTIRDAPELDLAYGMTLEAWIKPADTSFWRTVMMKDQRRNGLVYALFAASDTRVPAGNIDVNGQKIVRGPTVLPLNSWTHLATTYDGQTQRLYVNGIEVASRAQTGSMPNSKGALHLGGNTVWPNEFYRGVIDEVRIYNRALAPTEIQSDMNTPIGSTPPPPPPPSNVVWTGDMEEGSLADWYYPSTGPSGDYGGGLYNSGRYEAVASQDRAHTGSTALRARIWTPSSPTSGVRAFRWRESRLYRAAYYSAWFYVPTSYTLTGDPCCGRYWNLFQFKSRSTTGRNDPVWALYVGNRPTGELYVYAGWGWGGTAIAGPYATSDVSGKNYSQSVANLPIGRWTRIEAFLRESKDFDGRLTVWQDGVQLFDFVNIRTSYDNPDYNSWHASNEWSVNLYSDGLSPDPATIYIDDAQIRLP